jgi:hypothetical protein
MGTTSQEDLERRRKADQDGTEAIVLSMDLDDGAVGAEPDIFGTHAGGPQRISRAGAGAGRDPGDTDLLHFLSVLQSFSMRKLD